MKSTHFQNLTTILLLPLFLFLVGCSDDGPVGPDISSDIRGMVADEDGHTYPGTAVILRSASSGTTLRTDTTDIEGRFAFRRVAAGSYEVAATLPRASELVGKGPTAVTVVEGVPATGDITIRSLPIEAIVVGSEGYSQPGGRHDIRNALGDMPVGLDDPIYHSKDPEQLHPIKAPDGHHVSWAEWLSARGTARVFCDGGSGTQYTISLKALIPNGVYSVGVVLVDFLPEPTRVGTGSLGRSDGSENSFTASATGEGLLEVAMRPGPMSLNGHAPECTLTQVSSVTLWLFYHVDGRREPGSEESWVEHLRISI